MFVCGMLCQLGLTAAFLKRRYTLEASRSRALGESWMVRPVFGLGSREKSHGVPKADCLASRSTQTV
jgi:hypothetical protein